MTQKPELYGVSIINHPDELFSTLGSREDSDYVISGSPSDSIPHLAKPTGEKENGFYIYIGQCLTQTKFGLFFFRFLGINLWRRILGSTKTKAKPMYIQTKYQ